MVYHIKLLLSARALNWRGPAVGDVEDYDDWDDVVGGEDDEVNGEHECESVK